MNSADQAEDAEQSEAAGQSDLGDSNGGAALEELLAHIRQTRNLDLTGYKRNSLARRFEKRMQAVRCAGFADYQDYLEVHPEEFQALFDTILINVTGFFRDAAAWQYVTDEIVPRIVTGKQPGEAVRVWSAGYATGEEAYTLAMVFCEALGPEQFRARVKIYGTDADEYALTRRPVRRRTRRKPSRTSLADFSQPLLRERRRRPRLSQRPAPASDLRAAQPRAGRTDLAAGPSRVPQHADVLQRRHPG